MTLRKAHTLAGDQHYPARKAVTMAVLNAMTDPVDQVLYFSELRDAVADRPVGRNHERG